MIPAILLAGCLPDPILDEDMTLIRSLAFDHDAPLPPGSDPIVEEPGAAALGERLFHDPTLSADGSVSCETCHELDEYGDGDGADPRGTPTSQGAGGTTKRNAPTVLEVAYRERFGWVGQFCDLDDMSTFPLLSETVYGHGDAFPSVIASWIDTDAYNAAEWTAAFGGVSSDDDAIVVQAGQALEAFLRTIPPSVIPFDRWLEGDDSALNDAEVRGLVLFVGKAHCIDCHTGPLLSDGRIHATNVAGDDVGQDVELTGNEELGDKVCLIGETAAIEGGFATPPLRNVARTGPYMHDGSLATLEDLVWHYDVGGAADAEVVGHPDPRFLPLLLDEQERADLVAFLASLGPT